MNGTRHKPSRQNERPSRSLVPVLVPCKAGEAHDGVANFQRIKEGSVSRSGPKVRLFRNRDISQEAIEKALSQEDYELLKATLALKQSREIGDALMQERANAKLMSHLGWAGVDPKVFSYPGWSNVHVPQLATRPMDGARIVLWYAGRSGKFVPAIFCPDVRTAIFVRAFFSLRACPHCGVIFLPEKENVSYCCPAHGHAHRMARSRYLKPNAKSRKEPKSTGTTNRSEAQARELMATKRRK